MFLGIIPGVVQPGSQAIRLSEVTALGGSSGAHQFVKGASLFHWIGTRPEEG